MDEHALLGDRRHHIVLDEIIHEVAGTPFVDVRRREPGCITVLCNEFGFEPLVIVCRVVEDIVSPVASKTRSNQYPSLWIYLKAVGTIIPVCLFAVRPIVTLSRVSVEVVQSPIRVWSFSEQNCRLRLPLPGMVREKVNRTVLAFPERDIDAIIVPSFADFLSPPFVNTVRSATRCDIGTVC